MERVDQPEGTPAERKTVSSDLLMEVVEVGSATEASIHTASLIDVQSTIAAAMRNAA